MVSELLILFIRIIEELTIDLRYMASKASFDVSVCPHATA
jgi:hypothetical protein